MHKPGFPIPDHILAASFNIKSVNVFVHNPQNYFKNSYVAKCNNMLMFVQLFKNLLDKNNPIGGPETFFNFVWPYVCILNVDTAMQSSK